MKVKKAELAAVVFNPRDLPRENLPEIAFLGRSNVGKSSLLNCLANRKNLARTGATPGKTRAIFFYLINDELFLVDLPGYGYARVPREVRQNWAPLIETYLDNRRTLRGCVHLVDARIEPSEDDLLMRRWLLQRGLSAVTAATKADKLSRSALLKQLELARRRLELGGHELLVACSAKTGQGRDELWSSIVRFISP